MGPSFKLDLVRLRKLYLSRCRLSVGFFDWIYKGTTTLEVLDLAQVDIVAGQFNDICAALLGVKVCRIISLDISYTTVDCASLLAILRKIGSQLRYLNLIGCRSLER